MGCAALSAQPILSSPLHCTFSELSSTVRRPTSGRAAPHGHAPSTGHSAPSPSASAPSPPPSTTRWAAAHPHTNDATDSCEERDVTHLIASSLRAHLPTAPPHSPLLSSSPLSCIGARAMSESGSGGAAGGGGGASGESDAIRDQDRLLPIANISRIMKRVLPDHAKMSKESKSSIQEVPPHTTHLRRMAHARAHQRSRHHHRSPPSHPPLSACCPLLCVSV